MGTIDDFKTRIRNMLFVSVKNDIDSWIHDYYKQYLSPSYDDYQIVIEEKGKVYLRRRDGSDGYTSRLVLIYRSRFSVKDKEVNECVKQLKEYFERKQEDRKLKNEIHFFEDGLSKIQQNYISEVRKEKLEKLESDET